MEETTAAVSLPADVLLEILFLVKDDPATLFRCATTCRQWLRLIVDPSFLRRCWPPEKAPSCCTLLGFFTQEQRPGPEGNFTLQTPCFVPAPRSAMASLGRRALASFFPSAPAGLFHRAVPVAARHGLLPMDPNRAAVHLAVCDPLSGAYDVLPPVEWCSASAGYNGYAILTGADCPRHGEHRRSPCFKVLMIDISYNLYTFSSEEASWSRVPHVCLGDDACATGGPVVFPGNEGHVPFRQDEAVVHHGTAHWWCTGLSTMDMNAAESTGHLSRTEIPIPPQNSTGRSYSKLCLSTSIIDDDHDEAPSLLWMRQGTLEVEIWEPHGIDKDDDTLAWQCARVIELKQTQDMTETQVDTLHVLREKCGTLLLMDGYQRFYVADLKTGTMEEVRAWPRHWRKLVPFEADWSSIFIHRLGRQSTRY